jgi:hypothetical protein
VYEWQHVSMSSIGKVVCAQCKKPYLFHLYMIMWQYACIGFSLRLVSYVICILICACFYVDFIIIYFVRSSMYWYFHIISWIRFENGVWLLLVFNVIGRKRAGQIPVLKCTESWKCHISHCCTLTDTNSDDCVWYTFILKLDLSLNFNLYIRVLAFLTHCHD